MLTLQALTCFEGLRYPTQLRVECAPMQIVKQPVTELHPPRTIKNAYLLSDELWLIIFVALLI